MSGGALTDEQMRDCAAAAMRAAGDVPIIGLALIVWGRDGVSYISNLERPFVREQLRKMLAHLDAGAGAETALRAH